MFQLYNDYRSEKKFTGIDVFIHLSSGIIRNVIELCNRSLETAYNYGYDESNEKGLDIVYQDMGAREFYDSKSR